MHSPPEMPLDPTTVKWRITNDDVMGGLSSSRASAGAGSLHFVGEISLDNNGGFASVLGELETPLRRFHGVRLTVAGDGRRYQIRLRENRESAGIAWRASFEAKESPERITLLPDSFEPVIRGENVIGAKPLAHIPIKHLGFMAVGGKPGPFRLIASEIEFIQHAG